MSDTFFLESQMQIEQEKPLGINSDDFITTINEIQKNMQYLKKEEIHTYSDDILTAIQNYTELQQQELEQPIKRKLAQYFFEFVDEILERFLCKAKIQELNQFVKVRCMISKIVQLLSQNLTQDNLIIRKCLITLFNLDNKQNEFYSNNLDPPNRFFYSELISDLKERREWFESIKIGDLVDAVKIEENYRKQCWSHAKVIDKSDTRVKLSFLCDSSKYDRSVEWTSYELREYKSRCFDFEWRQQLKPDMVIDVCDTACVWYQSTILDTRSVIIEGISEPIKELYIGYRVYCEDGDIRDSQGRNFNGWTSKYDEWLSAHSPRLQQEKKMSKKLFKQASQNNSEKVIDDSNDIIFDYEYQNQFKNVKAIHRCQNIFLNYNINSSFIQFINDFGEGLNKILDIIRDSNEAALLQKTSNQNQEKIITFQALCDYIQIIYYVSPFLLKQFCMEYIPQLSNAIKQCIQSITEDNIRQFKREQISDMIRHYGIILMRYYSIGQKIEIIEELEYSIAKMCFESSFVKQKTIGMQLLTQIVQKFQKNSKKSIQLNEIKQEIEKNKYIEQLFNEDTHIQLLEKCTDLFIFLIEQNLFNENNMKNLWKVIQKSHDDTRICYYNLLKQVTKSFKAHHIQALYEEINLQEENKYKQYEIDILFEICFQEKGFFSEKYSFQIQIYNMIWDYINTFNEDIYNAQDLERSKMKLIVDKFCQLVNEKKKEKEIKFLQNQLIDNIKEGRNTYFSLEILESVMSQLNVYLESQIKECENLEKEYFNILESQPQDNQQTVIQFSEAVQANNSQNTGDSQQIENSGGQQSNLVNITDLQMELENEINNEDNEIWQRFPNLRLLSQQISEQSQQQDQQLSPSQHIQSSINKELFMSKLREKEKNYMRIQICKKQIKKKEQDRKQKCLEIRQIIIENLKHLKGKYNLQQLENSPQLTRSYISQIEKRINFLSFINEECQTQILDYELFSQLLIELIENQLVKAESEFFYRWLKRSNKRNKGIIPYIKQFFLDKVIKDDHFICTLSLEGFDCFKSLFVQINYEIGNIIAIDDNPQLKCIKDTSGGNKLNKNKNVDDSDLIFGEFRVDFLYLLNTNPQLLEGLDFLWKIAFLAQNEDVFDSGAKFLVNLYLKTTENLEDQVKEIRNQFFEICFKNITEKKYLVRTFQLIHYFLDYSELKGIGDLIPHSSETFVEKNTLIIKNQLPESANVLQIQKTFQFPCSYKTTLYQLRVDLSQIFKINIDEMLILVPGKNESYGTSIALKDFLNGYTLQALEFSNNQNVIVQKQEKKWSHPIKLIRDNDSLTKKASELFKEWFKAYSENGRMSMQNCAHFIESCTKDVCKVDDYRVIDVFKFWDSDKDGYLSEQDFLEFYRKGSKDKKETVMKNIQAHYYSDDLARLYELKMKLSQEDVQELPRYLLSQNETFQKQIFQLYDMNENISIDLNRMRFLIEKLFNRLPTCSYIKSILQNTEKVQQIFEQASKYEFFYILECIENKFFENSIEKDKGFQDLQEIINKLQSLQNLPNAQLTDNQNKETQIQEQSIQQPLNKNEQQTNQQVHQMSNENKEINLILQNFDANQQNNSSSNTQKNSANEFIVDFFSKGLFEKLLMKFQVLIQSWNSVNINVSQQNGMDGSMQQNCKELNLDNIQIKLFQKFFKIFNKFLSANLISEYPFIFYLRQYLCTIFITLEEIDEDLNNKQLSSTDSCNNSSNIEQENVDPQLIGPLLPQQNQAKQLCLQQPNIDKLQEIFIQFAKNNNNLHDYFLKFSNQNITLIVINTILSTLRQVGKFTNSYRNLVIDSLFTLLLLLYKNQDQFVKEFLSYPQSNLLLKEGLFYQKSKIIRQIFSFFIFLVLRQLNEKKHIIKILINLIPQNNSSDEMAETCTQFFSLLCLIFKKYKEKISSDGFDFDAAFVQVFETLKNIQSKENILSTQKDNFLSGYMQFTDVILKNSVNISQNTEMEYLKYLINNCLFDSVMTKDNQTYNSSTIQAIQELSIQQVFTQVQKIKCFHNDTRVQCYKQIQSLCQQYPEIFPSYVLDSITQIIQKVKRTQKVSPINYENNMKSNLGFVGLKNLGATCYINSMIQQIFTCNPLIFSILAADDLKEQELVANSQGTLYDDNILHQIQRMFAFLHLSIKKDFNTDGFCFSLKGYDGERTQTSLQQDTQEFLNLLVERIHNSLENTPFRGIFDTFYGVTTITERTCMKCMRKTQNEQPFYMIPIKIKGEKTLQGSLEKTFRQENIQDYRCDECKQVFEAQSQEYIKNLPNTLILNLFRISHNIETGLNQKDNNKITFEQNLNMHKFMYNTKNEMEIENMEQEDYDYTLKGIVVHDGTANYGHYFSYIKIAENKWLEFNDSAISNYNPKDIANDCFGVDSQELKIPKPYYESQKSAYLLFYEKVKKNSIEFKIKSQQEEEEIVSKLGIRNPITFSKWTCKQKQEDAENQSTQNSKDKDSYILRADYYDVNSYISETYKNQVAFDNYQFLCSRLMLNNQFLSFALDIIQQVPVPHFYQQLLSVKPLKPYIPIDSQKLSQDNLIEMNSFNEKYNYSKILQQIAFIYFNFILQMQECQAADNWFDLFYKFSILCPQTSFEIFKEYIVDKMDLFWQDILYNSSAKQRSNHKQIVLLLINVIIKYYNINLLQQSQLEQSNVQNPQSVIFQFLTNLFQGLHTQVINNFYRCEQYFDLLRDFADSDNIQAAYLIKCEMIEKLLDFYLYEESPIVNKYFKIKKSNQISGNQVQQQFNPLLATVYNLLCKKKYIMIMQQKDQQTFDKELVSNSQAFESIINQENLYNRALKMKSDPNILGRIISHMSYQNYQYSYFIASFIIKGINDKFRSDDIYHYLEIMSNFITILDDYKIYRFEWILGIPQLKKNQIYSDFSLQYFLDNTYYDYISTLNPDGNQNEQTKGFLSRILDCTIGYANYREHQVISKLLQLADINDQIFNYILTITPNNYELGYFIEFLGHYIQKNKLNILLDTNSAAILTQIEDTYKSILNKIQFQEEQLQKMYNDIQCFNNTPQNKNMNQNKPEQIERQRIFDTYIYGQFIQTRQIQCLQNILNVPDLDCITNEHDIYYCQNKLSAEGKNIVIPEEVKNNGRIELNKVNLESNIFLLFNEKIKHHQIAEEERKIVSENQNMVEETKQETVSANNSIQPKFSSESSLSNSKIANLIEQQNNNQNKHTDNLNQIKESDENMEEEVGQCTPLQYFQSQTSLTETEINCSSIQLDQNSKEQVNKVSHQREKEDKILININGINSDNLIREVILLNKSKSITYKVILQIQPKNQFSNLLQLSNFKYPSMIERMILPNTSVTLLTLTKSIPLHQWGDYELNFKVEIANEVKEQQIDEIGGDNNNNLFNAEFMSQLFKDYSENKFTQINPDLQQVQQFLDEQAAITAENSLFGHLMIQENTITCKYCTIKNSSNLTVCEICQNPLQNSQ
ncbi:ubiquitin carboxy-terminal hydrolase (macronuclear) [Tetrahymena thermophila SB210]|uniref:Ubiquitin carboxy-terminal hydrolase n=1 Tax=Tetrahymena thermophila (strain SB210) TaxID=312017 RepID=I7M6M5_TETTS|nr:ubiquitin carboxy-terminal hydrolase [Tetrahymena thermophila SB210]EAR85485.2 ubiquitin carboxy-terminal hydrolase [Tetrahymena thermophila SB210]|eukprot:XP_001033148.2 ubiquitin carboxy-terminal hydrolase [Tetrahymena thermophila SB210]